MSSRLIVTFDTLNEKKWGIINHAIYSILSQAFNDPSIHDLLSISKIYHTDKFLNANVYKGFGATITSTSSFNAINKNTFDIVLLYQKKDSSRDLYNFIPFFYLVSKYGNKISLGIDINSIEEKERYYFSCSQFLQNYVSIKNIFGGNQLYIIEDHSKTNSESGEITTYRTRRLAVIKELKNKTSSLFSPLIKINKQTKAILFDTQIDDLNEKVEQNNLISEIHSFIDVIV